MEGYKLYIRLGLVGLLVVVLLFAMTGQLYYMQIVQGEVYAKTNERTITRNVAIPAARGEILDRYGRPLISNRLSYAVTIDTKRLFAQKEPNEVIWQLVRLAENADTVFTDTLPISNPPFAFVEMSDTQHSRLTRYLKALKWEETYEELGEDGLMAKLCELYKLDPETEPYKLRRILGIRYELDLRDKVPTVPVYTFASDIDMTLVTRIKETGLPAVEVDTVPIREVKTEFASHLLGYVGQIPEEELEQYLEMGYARNEIVGRDGAEKAFESWLHGTAGIRTEETNMSGKVQNVLYSKVPEPGKNVMLTIDIVFQESVERILEQNILYMRENNEALKGLESEGGAAVVVDVKTGELLAAANYPTYSLQNLMANYSLLLQDPLTPLVNRAISGLYEPGSTFKMVTAAASLREGTITTRTRIVDRGIYTYYAPSYQPRCHIYPGSHGSVNVMEALKTSCNYFFYDVGRQATIDAIGAMAVQFGFGQPTGIELGAEKTGYVAGPSAAEQLGLRWYDGNTLQAAIGQGINLFTPLQIANYTATIANGGTHYAAHLLKTVKSYDYSDTYYEAPVQVLNTLDLEPEYLTAIQQGMRMVAQPGGTAASTFGSYEIPVAAKTGSVQVNNVPNNAVFVAYAPYDDPQIAVAVVIEKGGAGSRVAPIARDIFDAYFRLHSGMSDITPENQLLS